MVFWWICHHVGSVISWIFILTTLGNNFYMQISATIIEIPVLFNIIKTMHDTVTKMVSIHMFSRSMISINTISKF